MTKLSSLPKVKCVRWLLGDQLNAHHSWFKEPSESVLYVIAELPQEINYVIHHAQKVCAFFLAMEKFSKALQAAGHSMLHLTLDDTCKYESLPMLIEQIATQTQCTTFEYQRPDEWRLLEQLRNLKKSSNTDAFDKLNTFNKLDIVEADSEHFLLPFAELKDYFKPNTAVRMEMFYRKMRKRFDVLMTDGEPTGGRWNFDADNRKALNKAALADIPAPLLFNNDARAVLARLKKHDVKTLGQADEDLLWPVTRNQSLQLLDYFCEHGLSKFGQYQDAMTENSDHQWSLYHSRLSFSLNAKMLHPMQVINSALEHFGKSDGAINLAQIEGFIRQILGWREYVRGMYWLNMPNYQTLNALESNTPLPSWYWSGNTKMSCLQKSIKQTLTYSYAHHIQRLMVTGNFALLAGLSPDDVDAWYMGVYVDAIEWVEMPNTRGMALFSDGGLIASKPYAASGNYINKMSDYCKGCQYNVKEKIGEDACPFNSLYWHFIHRHEARFGRNPRMAFPYKTWQKNSTEQQRAILDRADELLEDLEIL